MKPPENDSNDNSNDQKNDDIAESKKRFQLKRLPFLLFGRVRWEPPPFLCVLGGFLLAPFIWLNAWRRRSPRAFSGSLTGLLVVVLVGVAGVNWYLSQPQPKRLSFTLTTPAPRLLEKDATIPPLLVAFDGSAARLKDVGKSIEQGITIKPEIAGTWTWIDDQNLRFDPEANWPVDRKYTVQMARELFPAHVLLEDYEFQFSTAPFVASISSISFYQDPLDPKQKKVVATVEFSHPIDPESFEDKLEMLLTGDKDALPGGKEQQYAMTVSYDEFFGEAYIHSETIPIPPDDASMVLTIDAGSQSSRGGNRVNTLKARTTVPGMYNYFRIEEAKFSLIRNDKNEPEQVLILRTSVGVNEEEVQKKISTVILPVDRPASPGRRASRNHYWRDVREVGKEVLALSIPLSLEPLPTDHEFATVHSFRFSADPEKAVYLKLKRGVNAYGGYVLAREYDSILRVPQYPRELEIMHEGSVLSLAGEKKLSVLARGVSSIRISVGQLRPGQINHLISQTRGSLKSPHFASRTLNDENLASFTREVRRLETVPAAQAQYTALDFSDSSTQGKGLFFLEVENWDEVHKRPISPSDRRLMLITDLGVLVKENRDGSRDVFVQSIEAGRPVADAEVEVLGKNGLPVAVARTDASGHATLTSLKDFKHEKTPVVYVVRKGSDLSFLPYKRRDRALNLSAFDISGVSTPATGDQLSAFLFSDRGIYRPGDTIHAGLAVRSTLWTKDTENVPLEITITDPRGREVFTRKFKLSQYGFDETSYSTKITSPTGQYTLRVHLIRDGRRYRELGSTTVRVEEFLPDRMRIRARLEPTRRSGWVAPSDLRAHVSLQNLYGTPATDRRVSGRLRLRPAFPSLPGYSDYQFFDPKRAERSFQEKIGDLQTDDAGEVSFELDLTRFANATYSLTFEAEGYEADGGRSVVAEASVLVSPLEHMIGYKADGDLKYIHLDTPRSVDLVALDPSGTKVTAGGLKAKLVELRFVSVLTRQPNDTYSYESKEKEIPISKKGLEVSADGLTYSLPTEMAGSFALVILDAADVELNRVPFNVIGPGNLSRDLETNAELQVKLNKEDYETGETIELEIKAPYTGAGLITIESDRVYTHRWFVTDTTASVQHIEVPQGLESNGYVVVSFLRAADSAEIFMSPLSSAAVPFSVSRDKQTIALELTAPELARPGENFEIGFKTDQPSRIVVFAVDEGILQVAKYKTPKPLDHFFRKRALEVRTLQILDMILPEFSMVRLQSGIGGDLGFELLQSNLNPFRRKTHKPAVFWSGIIDAGPEAQTLSFVPPDSFNGTLRVMAVALSADAIGVAEQKSQVRGHFVLSPNVPTFVAPGDRFEVSVTVANNVEGSGTDALCRLALDVPEGLELIGESVREINITEGREETARFELRALQKPGAASLRFNASFGDKRSKYDIELSVRPSMPFRVSTTSGHLKDDDVEVPVERKLYPEYRKLEVSASNLPIGLAQGLLGYLNNYPYGCTEQIVSRGMPALALLNHPEFGFSPAKTERQVAETVAVLVSRQNGEGAFGFWAGNSHISEFQTIYALHFLIEAQDRGYPIPSNLLNNALDWAERFAKEKRRTLPELRLQAHAVYLLTRSGRVTTKLITPLRRRLEDRFKKTWRKDLTAAYLAGSYGLMQQSREARSLISKVRIETEVETDYNAFYDPLIRNSQFLLVLAHDFPDRLGDIKGDVLLDWIDPILLSKYNTVSSSYTILAMAAYADVVGDVSVTEFQLEERVGKGEYTRLLPTGKAFARSTFAPEASELRITSKADQNLFYQILQEGFDLALPTEAVANGIEVHREYHDSDGKVVERATLGEELEVHLKIRSNDDKSYQNVAVVDLLPGGFEVVRSPGLRRGEVEGSDWRTNYVDVREDRVLIFGTIDDTIKTFVYRIKATNAGDYASPPSFAESMYDRRLQAQGLGSEIAVERPQ